MDGRVREREAADALDRRGALIVDAQASWAATASRTSSTAAAGALSEGEAIARAQGFHFARFFIDHAWAYWHLDFGSVATAAAHARASLEQVRKAGLHVTVGAVAAIARRR